jgi:glycosyltransferase involved in cell wall biosynthesis
MNQLSIVVSNRNRFDLSSNPTQWFIKSLENQTCAEFDLIISDGGSDNINDIENYRNDKIKILVLKTKLGEKFERARLNNIGIRNAKTPYILTTDVDMFFAPRFVETVIENLFPNTLVQSRTMYWKQQLVDKMYNGSINPFENIEDCKIGRIKKRTTAGGCQCAHINQWIKVGGFDERYIGWGSEDYDLYLRMQKSGAKTVWLGESIESIMLFHQPHDKDVKKDLEEQKINKKLLEAIDKYKVNVNGWGGIKNGK